MTWVYALGKAKGMIKIMRMKRFISRLLAFLIMVSCMLVITCNDARAATVAPSGVSVNLNTLNLRAGDSSVLVVTVSPPNATNQSVTWSSSNNSVVSVDNNGKLTASTTAVVGTTVTIKATSVANSSLFATCTVHIVTGGIQFIPCSLEGVPTTGAAQFSTASISLKDNDIDKSGNYIYYGVDLGIFQKPNSGSDWKTIAVQRALSPSLDFKISDFGSISKYDTSSVYSTGYRIVYQVAGSQSNPIIETDWKQVKQYFRFTSTPPIITCDDPGSLCVVPEPEPTTGEMTDKITAANKNLPDYMNKYLPGSEIAVVIPIKPAGIQYERFQVKLNLNSTNNVKIKILNNVSSVMNSVESGSVIEGEIMNPPTTTFNVYYVYKFQKTDAKTPLLDVEKEFTNEVTIIPIKTDGTVGTIIKQSLKLKIRDALMNLR